jgi:hypothetical protein
MSDYPPCYNRKPFADVRVVQDGWTSDGRRNMITIPDKMSKTCPQPKAPFGEAFIQGWDCGQCVWLR